ncbi:hypothetical protein BH10PSE19_BH10PSE19_12900 [soil metagenome]
MMKKILKLSCFVLSLFIFGYTHAQQNVCFSDNILCPAPPIVAVLPPMVVTPKVELPRCKAQQAYHTPSIPLQYFDTLEIRGDMEVELQTGSKRAYLEATGDLRILRNLNANVYGNTLLITRKDEICLRDCERPRIRIHANYLRRLIHRGNGNVHLNGVVNLEELTQEGTGIMQIYWVKGGVVTLHANGSGTIVLAGVAYQLNADLAGQIHLDARFLRTKKGFIHTMQNSRADVWVKDSLDAFAQGYSNIYYFTKPIYIYTALLDGGSVLDMSSVHAAIVRFR